MNTSYDYLVCDVFTEKLYSGNQLAVLPNAEGLTDAQMQQIAREFNYSETAFVFNTNHNFYKKLKIFTPLNEVPFAGHPNIGTAFALTSLGQFGEIKNPKRVTFEQKAGLVEIEISIDNNGKIFCELKAPEKFSLGTEIPVDLIASAISILPSQIITDTHLPCVASVGLPFVFVELRNSDILKKAKINIEGFEQIMLTGIQPSLYLYVKGNEKFNILSRMFAPLSGVYEDPATGSAGCAVSALLAYHHHSNSEIFTYTIGQGFEIRRKSVLKSRVVKEDSSIKSAWIGGNAIISCRGKITVN